MSAAPRTLRGLVRVREDLPARCLVYVKVEDVSRADAASTLVAETVLPIEQPLRAGATVPFSVTVPAVSDRSRYSVRVHVDCNGSGEVRAGDRISTRAYPVMTQGNPDHVEVEVHAI